MIRKGLCTVCIICLLSSTGYAATIRVKQDGSGDDKSILGGVYQANPYDTVLVSQGTYYESTIIILDPVHLISESGPELTTIAHYGYPGEDLMCVIYIDRISEGSIIGFTIRDGDCDLASSGGGIKLMCSEVLIMNNRIEHNWCANGGGIDIWGNPSPSIINNLIISNSTFAGGGIIVDDSSPIIMNNTIVGNTASVSFAGIYVMGSENIPTIKYNLICWNAAPPSYCGGIYVSTLIDSIVFECNDSWNNWPAGSDYCGLVSDRVGVDGNISEDPLFCGEQGSGNYYLQQGSPCAESNVPAFCNNVRIGYYPVSCLVAAKESSWGSIKTINKPGENQNGEKETNRK